MIITPTESALVVVTVMCGYCSVMHTHTHLMGEVYKLLISIVTSSVNESDNIKVMWWTRKYFFIVNMQVYAEWSVVRTFYIMMLHMRT